MIILHAGYVDDVLLVWAEQPASVPPPLDEPALKIRRKSARAASPPALSPYDAGESLLRSALEQIGLKSIHEQPSQTVTVWLPTRDHQPLASSPMISDASPTKGAVRIQPWHVTALPLSTAHTVDLLCRTVKGAAPIAGLVLGTSVIYWSTALRLAGSMTARQQYLPGIRVQGKGCFAQWQPCFGARDSVLLNQLATAMPDVCRAIRTIDSDIAPEAAPPQVLHSFVSAVVDYLARPAKPSPAGPRLAPQRKRTKAQSKQHHSLHEAWIAALRSTDTDTELTGDTRGLNALADQLKEWKRPLSMSLETPFRLCFRLEEPFRDEENDVPAAEGQWTLRYLLQANDDPSLLIPVENAWKPSEAEAKLLQRGGYKPREHLLASLGQASKVSPYIEASLKAALPGECSLETEAAFQFLTETSWMLEQSGFGVLFPAWWSRKGTKVRLAARAIVKAPKMKAKAGLSLQTLVDFDWELALGEHTLTFEELETLALQKSSLVSIRGQWVQLDANEIAEAIRFWKEKRQHKTSLRDIMRMSMGGSGGPAGLPIADVHANGWIKEFLSGLHNKAERERVKIPEGFVGTLRPYQERGYAWLEFLRQWGLGACLADDMGLGKTCTTLALIQQQRETGETRPALIICPTSVVGNWQKEVQRFTPSLNVMVHHGLSRVKGEKFVEEAEGCAIVLSSYALLHRDFETLKRAAWSSVILDEAQNIKNSETKQSKAARELKADFKVALTGTPVENHVGDLWSLMEFLNPGFLGTEKEFKRSFFVPIQSGSDPEAATRLKQLTGPFMLRRLKTDRSIITDLPDKMEMKVYCTLTTEQASLYRAVVNELEAGLDGSEGIQRNGMVLAALSKIKQVCNHPVHFLKDNSTLPGRSSKLTRLTEMLEEAMEAGDKVLLFTQFTEMGQLLRKHLMETFGQDVLFLHGATTKPARDKMVAQFQTEADGPKIFILSLKAGGTGLNLTAANHVFHFDRWWNPAVENQATDRAFRIGQNRNVQVHKFICVGTLEERIDELIESKSAVAGAVVGTGEDWLTKLSNTELKQLFALRTEALSEA